MTDRHNQTSAIYLQAAIELMNDKTLSIKPKQIDISPLFADLTLKPFMVDLGSDVIIEGLNITHGYLHCRGHAYIHP